MHVNHYGLSYLKKMLILLLSNSIMLGSINTSGLMDNTRFMKKGIETTR